MATPARRVSAAAALLYMLYLTVCATCLVLYWNMKWTVWELIVTGHTYVDGNLKMLLNCLLHIEGW